MAGDKKGNKRKGKKMTDKGRRNAWYDPLDDNAHEQVEPRPEPDGEESLTERWALPGDDEKPERELPRITAQERSN